MANVSCTCLFFILMIFSHELCDVEGRNLKISKSLKCAKCLLSPDGQSKSKPIARDTNNHDASPSLLHHGTKTTEGFVDAFRPTPPGHSPGVGH